MIFEKTLNSISDKFVDLGTPYIGKVFAAAAFAFSLSNIGPLDTARTFYSVIIGDTPVLKKELVEYCREGIIKNQINYLTPNQIEKTLASKLEYKLIEGEKINPSEVRIDALWDASEDLAKSPYQHWIWPSL